MAAVHPGAPAPAPRLSIKVYLVIQAHPSPEALDRIERRIIAAKLTQEAAQRLADSIPGAYVQKIVADKT